MAQASVHSTPKICILGGGFGGLYTALNLLSFSWDASHQPEITLVDQGDRFVFSPLLYELITGELQTWEIAPPYTELLANTGIRFQQAGVSSIDIEQKCVHLDGDKPSISYDFLVLALGGETPLTIVPGAEQHAIPFRTIADAYRLQEKLRMLEQSDADKIRVAIVGGGYSGVELACKIAERLGDRGRVRIIEKSTQILSTSPEFNRKAALKALNDQKVWVDLETTLTNIEDSSITLDYKNQVDTIPVDIVMWTIGNKVSETVQAVSLPKTDRQQIKVTPTLQVIDHPDIFALGDLAACQDAEGQSIPASAQAALQEAQYAAWNIWASATGRSLLPFRYQNLGEMLTLGTGTAALAGLGITLDGPLAHVARRLAYLYRMPTLDHQMKVGLNWIMKPLRDLMPT
ncbi:MAG: NAD(P)/FAD-dependent oxidoreductase [Leptolyngbyaceae bacterium]|nr:NAD(P)/FAD-dependent oxidoreductase [Leptolyngbyaceae bacterium]